MSFATESRTSPERSGTTAKYSFGSRSRRELQGVHPDLVRVATRALELGVMDFTVTDGVRTLEEQAKLYRQGRSDPGPIVTWTLESNHLPKEDGYGYAIDIAPYPIDYHNLREFHELAGVMKAAAAIEGVKIVWGGDWGSPDRPHYELAT